jgi:hypothetical protein
MATQRDKVPEAPAPLAVSVLSEQEVQWLSASLTGLANTLESIWNDMAVAGYGGPGAVVRGAQETLAQTPESRERLKSYWTEHAKERLAALADPVNVLRGKFPDFCTYRSAFMSQLRADAPGLQTIQG